MDVKEILNSGVEQKVFLSAEALVAQSGKIIYHEQVGELSAKSQFDLASLTKPLTISLLAFQFVDKGLLSFENTVGDFFVTPTLSKITILELLEHRSGLIAWHPFFKDKLSQKNLDFEKVKTEILNQILHDQTLLKNNKTCEYSDLGFILLGILLEKISQKSLDELFQQQIIKPLQLSKKLNYYKVNEALPNTIDFVPSEYCTKRNALIKGRVQDENAYVMGGVSGHAGLFSNALALHELFQDLQKADTEGSKILSKKNYHRLQNALGVKLTLRERFLFGFDTVNEKSPNFGDSFNRQWSLCHLGFSGTSFVWDIKAKLWIFLLANPRMFGRSQNSIVGFRKRFHNAIMKKV